jgi:hypothetical protein
MLASQIKIDDEQETDMQYLGAYFPTFTWVLRDVNIDFKHLTPRSYLLNLLEDERDPRRYSLDEVGKRNDIRKCIKSIFCGEKNLECLALKKPTDGEICPEMELKPEFVKSCQDVVSQLKSKLSAKTIRESPLTPTMFLNLALEYIDQLNSGQQLTILPSFERVVQIEANDFSE